MTLIGYFRGVKLTTPDKHVVGPVGGDHAELSLEIENERARTACLNGLRNIGVPVQDGAAHVRGLQIAPLQAYLFAIDSLKLASRRGDVLTVNQQSGHAYNYAVQAGLNLTTVEKALTDIVVDSRRTFFERFAKRGHVSSRMVTDLILADLSDAKTGYGWKPKLGERSDYKEMIRQPVDLIYQKLGDELTRRLGSLSGKSSQVRAKIVRSMHLALMRAEAFGRAVGVSPGTKIDSIREQVAKARAPLSVHVDASSRHILSVTRDVSQPEQAVSSVGSTINFSGIGSGIGLGFSLLVRGL